MREHGSNLEFISIVNRDGLGTRPLREDQKEFFSTIEWGLKRLSITANTYLAFNTSVCVVKIKEK